MAELPGDATIILHAGKFEMDCSNLRDAEALLEKGLHAAPNDDYVLHTLGILNLRKAENEKSDLLRRSYYRTSKEYFQRKLDLDPFTEYGYVGYLDLLLEWSRHAEDDEERGERLAHAYQLLNQGLDFVAEEDHSRLLLKRTQVLDALGKSEAATEKLYKDYKSGETPIAYELYGIRLLEDNRLDEAVKILEEGNEKFKGSPRLLFQLIRATSKIACDTDGYRVLLGFVRDYLKIDHNNLFVNLQRAVILYLLRDIDAAFTAFSVN
jgi:tetratricopeptide (TPR) repeat protein